MKLGTLLYTGKAKCVYEADDLKERIIEFRDDVTAGNGAKHASLTDKGRVNCRVNAFIMDYLAQNGIKTHHIKLLDDTHELVHCLTMLPVECVVRNVVAGGLAKRLGIAEGTILTEPIFEFFLKDDALNDPMINESHIIVFKWATLKQIETMKSLSLRINQLLKKLFSAVDITLVDFKLEFGLYHDELYLGDEITSDGCRLWDTKTQNKLDKDRFRRDLGDVIDHYKEVAQRLGVSL